MPLSTAYDDRAAKWARTGRTTRRRGRRHGFSTPLSDDDLDRLLDITEGWEREKRDAIRGARRERDRERLKDELHAIRGACAVTAAVRAARVLRRTGAV